MNLPEQFIVKMKDILKEDFDHFLKSYDQGRFFGLRANTLKISPKELKDILSYLDEPIPWSSDGFYYPEEERPGKNPLFYAGLYYIQEPSAMYPGEALGVRSGDFVLDLCAAPGGKSIQLAAKLGENGILVVNDVNQQRAKVLLKNIEKYGVKNALVLNERPENIQRAFGGFFDKILVDAPCSGEGMFRKDPDMIKTWSPSEVEKYAKWQQEILKAASQCLKKGGNLVYSTCTFSIEENEDRVRALVDSMSSFNLEECIRLWPHQIKGEGHFIAKIKSRCEDSSKGNGHSISKVVLNKATKEALENFCSGIWKNENYYLSLLPQNGNLVERDGHILWEHSQLPSLKGLKVLRSGWLLGTMDRDRFKPSQAFAMALNRNDSENAVQILNLSSKDHKELNYAHRYLKGETIQLEDTKFQKGWYLVSIDSFPLGWAKSAEFSLKNEYPPGWRWLDADN